MPDTDAYQNTIARLEPDIAMIDPGAYYASAAVSLKRIADAMHALTPAQLIAAGANLRTALDSDPRTQTITPAPGLRLVSDRDKAEDDVHFIHMGELALPFDPIERAELTPAQRQRMQGFLISLRRLVDPVGLKIMFSMDAWLVAQMVRYLFTPEGFGRDLDDVVEMPPLRDLDLK